MRIVIVGDVMLGRLVDQFMREMPPEYPWGDTLPLFGAADLRVCNLECVLSDRGRPWSATPKMFHFRSDRKNVAVLQAAGIDLVSLANNHVLDYEYDALVDMLATLEQAGIEYAGVGRNRREAWRPAIVRRNGSLVAMIAFTDNEPDWEAAEGAPGICYVPADLEDERARRLLRLATATKAEAGFLIVSCHWGPNWGYRPPEEHVSLARALIDAGADVVFGHSAHVFRGIEIYRGRPILYGTGDFIDDYAVDEIERNDESFVFCLEVAGRGVREISLYPTMICNFQARLADSGEAPAIAGKMQALCGELRTEAWWSPPESCLKIRLPEPAQHAA